MDIREESTERLLIDLGRLKESSLPPKAGEIPEDEESSLSASDSVLKIWAKQREIARLAALGYKQQEICRALKLSTSCVWVALNKNPLVQEQVALLQGKRDASTVDVSKRIKALQPLVLEVLEDDLLLEPNGSVQLRKLRNDTAKHLASMGGNGPVTKSISASGVFTLADLKKINERAAELRGESVSKEDNKGEEPEEIEYEEVG